MKILTIAFKDITQSFRSFLAIAMMFLVPMLMTGLFALLFGSGGEEDSPADIELPITPVQIVNLDQGELGKTIVEQLSGDNFADLLAVTIADDPESARSAVDEQQAHAAVIIPADLSMALFSPGAQTVIEVYQDPTLTVGPGILVTILNQFADGFSGSTIAIEVINEQLAASGYTLSQEQMMSVIGQYQLVFADYTSNQNTLKVETPSGESTNQGVAGILSMVMGGMMIFYSFFTATNAANSLLTEEANLTLGRMLTTATSPVEVIAGKLVAAAMMVFVQILVLLSFSWLVFDTQWGEPWMLVLFAFATTLGAVTFGLFAISWAKDRKQASLIVGAGVTITGMLGMSNMFMINSPNPSQVISKLSLLVPQGWANQALIHIMDRFPTTDVLFSLLGLLGYSLVMFFIGYKRFMKRFA